VGWVGDFVEVDLGVVEGDFLVEGLALADVFHDGWVGADFGVGVEVGVLELAQGEALGF